MDFINGRGNYNNGTGAFDVSSPHSDSTRIENLAPDNGGISFNETVAQQITDDNFKFKDLINSKEVERAIEGAGEHSEAFANSLMHRLNYLNKLKDELNEVLAESSPNDSSMERVISQKTQALKDFMTGLGGDWKFFKLDEIKDFVNIRRTHIEDFKSIEDFNVWFGGISAKVGEYIKQDSEYSREMNKYLTFLSDKAAEKFSVQQ